jgi:RecA-family ATPase
MEEDNVIAYRPNGRMNGVAPAHPMTPRRPMDWGKLADLTPPMRKWSVSHWLTHGPTLFAGAGGIGKTLLAQTLATALAAKARYLDDISEQHVVLFWACEDDHDELWRRQVQICAYLGIDMRELTDWLILEPRFGLDNTLYATTFGTPSWTPLRDELKSQLRDYAASVLFLDNIGQTFGAEENKRHHVTSFINGIAGLVTDYPFSPVIMGHPAKAQDSEYAGNAAWENAVRMRWFMGHKLPDQKLEDGEEPDQNVRYISKRKTNYSTKDYRKLEYKNGVFVPEELQHGSFQTRFGNRDADAEACVLAALNRFHAVNVRVTGGHGTSDYLLRRMRDSRMCDNHSDRDLKQALSRLILAGRVIEAQVGTYANRSPKLGLVVKP